MNSARFENSPIGKLEPITVEHRGDRVSHFAFVPDPLPASVVLRPDTYAAIERAAMSIGALEGAASQLESPYWITRPSIRREAVSTSALEGTYATLEELFVAGLETGDPADDRTREVANYVAAAEQGVAAVQERPVSMNLILTLHERLLAGTRDAQYGGRVRDGQVAIGQRGAPVTQARFVPPPAGDVLDRLLTDWERWNYRVDDIPLLARVAISHYQFEALHPFFEGNGRMGRLMVVLLLIDRGALSNHYLVLSPYIEARRQQYMDLLLETSASGDFDPLVRFFAEALASEAASARKRISGLQKYRDGVVSRLRGNGLRGTIIEVAEGLIEQPITTASALSASYDVVFQTANRVIDRLVRDGVLEEMTGRSYGRVFYAPEVMNLLRAD